MRVWVVIDVTLHLGDCLDVMRAMPDGCVDAVVTDPPYGLSFMGKGWDHGVPGVEFWIEALRVAKPGAHLLAFGGTRTFHRLACAIEDAGWEIKDCLSWLYGSGFPKHKTLLKPAWEPVVMAAKAGRRVVNVDACRLGGAWSTWRRADGSINPGIGGSSPAPMDRASGVGRTIAAREHPSGRWPANVCLDEEAAAVLDEQSGVLATRGNRAPSLGVFDGYHGGGKSIRDCGAAANHGDSGGASRFFYVAKASRSEREAGLDGFEVRPGTIGQKRCALCGRQAINMSGTCECPDPQWVMGADVLKARNHHPTVKPVALMRWLVRLVTPPGGLVLDPFTGSGTTALACIAEGRAFVGIEREPEYHAIAEARIAHARGETLPSDEQRGLDFGCGS